MTPAQALAFFVLEVTRASTQFGIAPPKVTAISVDERHRSATANFLAYIVPNVNPAKPHELHVNWALLRYADSASPYSAKKLLRCIARHEAAHIYLGHARGAMDLKERDHNEDLVDWETRFRWNEPARCGLIETPKVASK